MDPVVQVECGGPICVKVFPVKESRSASATWTPADGRSTYWWLEVSADTLQRAPWPLSQTVGGRFHPGGLGKRDAAVYENQAARCAMALGGLRRARCRSSRHLAGLAHYQQTVDHHQCRSQAVDAERGGHEPWWASTLAMSPYAARASTSIASPSARR
jgi:hypothetical protein